MLEGFSTKNLTKWKEDWLLLQEVQAELDLKQLRI